LLDDETSVPLSHPVRLRVGKEVRIVIDDSDPFTPPIPHPSLIKAIAKAHRFNTGCYIVGSVGLPIWQKARRRNGTDSYYSQILRLAYLAPDVTNAILEGRQPSGLTATMIEHSGLPLSWQRERSALGFA
jgi:site-specific DNA recombinase